MTALLAHWAIASLIAHLAYGAVLGAIAAEQRTPLPRHRTIHGEQLAA